VRDGTEIRTSYLQKYKKGIFTWMTGVAHSNTSSSVPCWCFHENWRLWEGVKWRMCHKYTYFVFIEFSSVFDCHCLNKYLKRAHNGWCCRNMKTGYWECLPSARRHTLHLTNILLISSHGFISQVNWWWLAKLSDKIMALYFYSVLDILFPQPLICYLNLHIKLF